MSSTAPIVSPCLKKVELSIVLGDFIVDKV